MIVNGKCLLAAAPIKGMERCKMRSGDVTYGLSEAGYDIRIKQTVLFKPHYVFGEDREQPWIRGSAASKHYDETGRQIGMLNKGRFILASAIEEFQMPPNLVGIVHDKSSWARKGLSVFNTVIEPGWNGFLTLELVYHGQDDLIIPAGSGIAQVIFHQLAEMQQYKGRYQNQADEAVPAKPIV